jgi:hypothetical protein
MRANSGIYFVTADFIVSEAPSIGVLRAAQTCKMRKCDDRYLIAVRR